MQDVHTVQRGLQATGEQKNPSCMKHSTVQQHARLAVTERVSVQLLSGVVVCSYYLEFWLKMMINKTQRKEGVSLQELVKAANITTEAGSRRESFQPSREIS